MRYEKLLLTLQQQLIKSDWWTIRDQETDGLHHCSRALIENSLSRITIYYCE